MPSKPSKPEVQPQPSREEMLAHVSKLSYEEAETKLEEIIDRIESGQIGLEESERAYEHGLILRDHCRAILARVEQRITELNPEAEK